MLKKVPRYFLSTLIIEHYLDTQIIIKKNLSCFSPRIRISGKNIIFDDKKINKSNVCKNNKLFNLCDVEVGRILIPKQEPYGKKSSFKYSLRYNDDDDVIKLLCIKLPQMIGYVKHFDSNKTMSIINDNVYDND